MDVRTISFVSNPSPPPSLDPCYISDFFFVLLALFVMLFEGSLEAKLPTIWRDENGTARKKLGRGESQQGKEKR